MAILLLLSNKTDLFIFSHNSQPHNLSSRLRGELLHSEEEQMQRETWWPLQRYSDNTFCCVLLWLYNIL